MPFETGRISLHEACDFITDGSHFSPIPQPEGHPIVTAKDIPDGRIRLDTCARISDADWLLLKKQNCAPAPGDVLLSKDGTIGRVVSYQSDLGVVVLSSVAILRPSPTVNSDYLAYALRSESFSVQLRKLESGSALKRIILRDIRRLEFSFPPSLEEQTKIAEILSMVDRAIEQTGALIAKQQRIKTGLMQDLLTRGIDEQGNLRSEQTHEFKDSPLGRIPIEWKVGCFEDYVVGDAGIKPGPFGSSLTKDSYSEFGYRVYGQEQVIGGSLDIGDYYIPERKFSDLSSFAVRQGDVLISLVGTIGHVLIVPPDHCPGVINPRLLRFRPDLLRCRPVFLKVLLLSQPVRLQLDAFATGGTMPVLSAGIIRKLRIIILEVPEQDRISQAIDGSEQVLLSYSRDLAKLRCIKTGLMQDLLSGNRCVTALLPQPGGEIT